MTSTPGGIITTELRRLGDSTSGWAVGSKKKTCSYDAIEEESGKRGVGKRLDDVSATSPFRPITRVCVFIGVQREFDNTNTDTLLLLPMQAFVLLPRPH